MVLYTTIHILLRCADLNHNDFQGHTSGWDADDAVEYSAEYVADQTFAAAGLFGAAEAVALNSDALSDLESEDEIQMIEDALNEEEEEMEEGRKKGKCKPSKGKRFAKRVDGKCRSFGQKGKASDGGDRIRPGTKKAHAYCARSAKIKKCKNPPCANTLSRKKWKCQGSRSVPE